MENLGLIAAIGPNYELGIANHLIWHIKDDLNFYKEMTMNKNIIMGRTTLESMPKSALKNRYPIILSRKEYTKDTGYLYFQEIGALLQYIKSSKEQFMVVGGASIYQQFLSYVDYMYLTHVNSSKELKADCYFPKFQEEMWNNEEIKQGIDGIYSYQICKYTKKHILKKRNKR